MTDTPIPPVAAGPSRPIALAPAVRSVLGLLAAASLLALLGAWWPMAQPGPVWLRPVLTLLQVTIAVGAVLGWQSGSRALRQSAPALALLATLAVWLPAAFAGPSAWLPGLPLLAAALCAVHLAASPPAALFCSTLAVTGTVGLALADAARRWSASGASAGPSGAGVEGGLGLVWVGAVAVLVGAAVLGRQLAVQLQQLEQSARQRDRRVRALQRMVIDASWETDAALRLRRLAWRQPNGRTQAVTEALGRRPWALPPLVLSPDLEDFLRAEIESRAMLRDVVVQWRCPDGQERHFRVSGEPLLDGRGRFRGYWGVARDVSREARALKAQASAERRYRHLFSGLPTPLMLLRQGRIVEANGAAAAMLGYESVDAMRGHDLLFEHMDDDQRLAAQDRLEQLEDGSADQWLPYETRRLQRVDGASVYTLSSAAPTESEGRAAALGVYIDETRTRTIEMALRRSESLIGRILELGRDLLWLSDQDTGRCVMANDRFLTALNLPREQVVGRTERQLGLWRSMADRDRVVRAAMQEEALRDLPMELQLGRSGWVRLRVSAARVPSGRVGWVLMCAQRLPADEPRGTDPWRSTAFDGGDSPNGPLSAASGPFGLAGTWSPAASRTDLPLRTGAPNGTAAPRQPAEEHWFGQSQPLPPPVQPAGD